ncbi:unnamed protein product, partial [Durusdinium trenchii]
NFSTYLWSPDEVQMMRTVGNTRGKELYRRGAPLSWQPQDSKERKVKICTEIYGTEAVQRAVKENIVVASRAEQGQAPATAPSTGGYTSGTMAPAAGAHTKDPSPNWLDDWTVLGSESVGKTKENLLDGWIESPCSVKPTSPVVQHGDVAFQKPLKQEAPVTKHQDDLAEVFASAFPMPKPVAVENPFRCGCAQKSSDREKDFWDSVNWDELLS